MLQYRFKKIEQIQENINMWFSTPTKIHPIFGEIRFSRRKNCWEGGFLFPDKDDWTEAQISIPGDKNSPTELAGWWCEFHKHVSDLCVEAAGLLYANSTIAMPEFLPLCQIYSVELPESAENLSWFIEWAYPLSLPQSAVAFSEEVPSEMYGVLKVEYHGWKAVRVL